METHDDNVMNYMIANIENKTVFYHEIVWVQHNGLIPKGKLVCHLDGRTENNDISNLYLVDENKEHGDLHTDKIFHEDSYDEEFVKKHFNDVYQNLQQLKMKNIV